MACLELSPDSDSLKVPNLCWQVKTSTFVATVKHQKAVVIKIFTSTDNTDRYVDAATMRELGQVTLNITDPSKVIAPEAYRFTVNFMFGGSELTLTAVDDQTKQQVQTRVVFVAE